MNTNTEEYESTIEAVSVLVSEGNHELALRLTQNALKKISVDKDKGLIDEQKFNELETELTRKYINSRAKLDNEKHVYLRTFLKTLIVSATIATTIALTSFFVVTKMMAGQVDKITDILKYEIAFFRTEIQNELIKEIPEISNALKKEIPAITEKLKEEIEEKSMGIDRFYFYTKLWEIDKKYRFEGKEMPPPVAELKREIESKIIELIKNGPEK